MTSQLTDLDDAVRQFDVGLLLSSTAALRFALVQSGKLKIRSATVSYPRRQPKQNGRRRPAERHLENEIFPEQVPPHTDRSRR